MGTSTIRCQFYVPLVSDFQLEYLGLESINMLFWMCFESWIFPGYLLRDQRGLDLEFQKKSASFYSPLLKKPSVYYILVPWHVSAILYMR